MRDGDLPEMAKSYRDVDAPGTYTLKSTCTIRAAAERQIFVSLAEQSTEFIGICDMTLIPIFINEAGRRLVGLDSEDEALRTEVKDFFFPEDQQFIYEEFFPRVLRDGRAEMEIRFCHFKTGWPLWMMYNVFHVLDTEGNVIGFATVSRDITDRKAMEEKLRNSQADLNRAQLVGHIGNWRLNVRQNKLTLSEENHRIFGIPEGTSMTYETFLSTIHPDDREYVVQKWQAALCGEPYNIEHRLIVDGKVKWVREKAELEFDQDGLLQGAFGTTQDITQRKLDDEAMREADRHKNEFLAMLAHELRNPLTPICNAMAILKIPGLPEPSRQASQALVDRQLQHMVRLIDDLMDVSRISSGKLQLRKERVDVVGVLQDVLEVAQTNIERSGHTLTVSLPSLPIHLDADPVRLTQVFHNLLNNACKYTKCGGVIDVSLVTNDHDVVIEIKDTGIGIPPEFHRSVFELFTQIPSATGQADGGLGIGLALVHSLVEMHGGHISVESEGHDKGSKFVVRLPMSYEMSNTQSLKAQSSESHAVKSMRILVVDDNRDVSKSLVMLLELYGYSVATAYDGQEAIEVVARYQPDVVLLDIGMPRLNGHDACRIIRDKPWGKNIKIYALTGLGGEDVQLKSKECGFTGHIVKPIDSAVLLQLLAENDTATA